MALYVEIVYHGAGSQTIGSPKAKSLIPGTVAFVSKVVRNDLG